MAKNFTIMPSLFTILVLLFSDHVLLGTAQATDNETRSKISKSNTHLPFQGVNFLGYNTTLTESRHHKPVPSDYFDQSFKMISQAGLNIIRFLVNWESYNKNPSLFMSELATVAGLADKWKLNVIYTNNQFHISSWLDPISGYGFPSILFKNDKNLPYGGGGSSDNETAKLWWTNWYNRSIFDINGNDGWILQAEYLKNIVSAVDDYKSTLGYEILNEPQVYSADQWKKIGNYNTFMTDELRKLTSKIIVFDRQLPSDVGGPIYALPDNMAKMAPKNTTNVIFKATLFGIPTHCSYAEARLNTAARTAQILGIPLWLGEFNVGVTSLFPYADVDQNDVDLFISKFGEVNSWGWSFWMWSFREHPRNVKNYDLIKVTDHDIKTTKYFGFLENAVFEYKRNASLNINGNGKQPIVDNADFRTMKNKSDSRLPSKDTICPTAPIMKIDGTLPETDFFKSTPYNPVAIYIDPLPARVFIEGEAYDSGSGIKKVEIRLKDTSYGNVIPNSDGDWSRWRYMILLTGNSLENELIVRVQDGAGNVKHHTVFFHTMKS